MILSFALLTVPTSLAWWWPTQGTWVETDHLTASDATEDGVWGNPSHWGVHFGSTVAIDGDTLIAGTQYDLFRDGPGTPDGDGGDWIYVFEKGSDGGWEEVAKLVPADAHEGDTFAWSLDVDSESGVIVAGNPAAEKIYIFERSDDAWIQSATFTAPDDGRDSPGIYAYTVAVSGTTVATGLEPDLFLYEKAGDQWTKADTLAGGSYVDLDGDSLVTSVWNEEAQRNGYAVYDKRGGSWTEVSRLDPASEFDDAPLGGTENTIGCDPSLNERGNVVVIGACIDRRVYEIPTEHTVGVGGVGPFSVNAGAVGSAWIYEKVDNEWVLTADIPNPDPNPGPGDLFGLSVDASGHRVVIGSPFDDNNGGQDGDGAAYLYEKVGDEWLLTGKLRNHDNGPYGGGDVFGSSVGISGEAVVAGAPFDDQRRDGTPSPADDDGDIPPCVHGEIPWDCDEGENAGSVYVFETVVSNDPREPGDRRHESGPIGR